MLNDLFRLQLLPHPIFRYPLQLIMIITKITSDPVKNQAALRFAFQLLINEGGGKHGDLYANR